MNWNREKGALDISTLQQLYVQGLLTPEQLVPIILERNKAYKDNAIWIYLLNDSELKSQTTALKKRLENVNGDYTQLPLYGIPFAVKDNIDVAGFPTTAACSDYSYTPSENAFVVECLLNAGALFIGKTNLDQFATGLVGTRSPYGVVKNIFNPAYISGGSSSGSAVAVTAGLVAFSLGTDTAGSGRVPAAFGNIIGLKPSRGLLSVRGVVPACQSLDCVSIFTLNSLDANFILQQCLKEDVKDPWQKPVKEWQHLIAEIQTTEIKSSAKIRIGIIQNEDLDFFDNSDYARLYQNASKNLSLIDCELISIPFTLFKEAGKLLYDGPWVAERYTGLKSFIKDHANSILPVTLNIIENGKHFSASDTFQGMYRMQALRKECAQLFKNLDVILFPTTGTIYTIAEIEASPIKLNSNLGIYTNFVNLLDLCGITVPQAFDAKGLPFGLTLLAPALHESLLLKLAESLHAKANLPWGYNFLPINDKSNKSTYPIYPFAKPEKPDEKILIAVFGLHLRGLALNNQLTDLNAEFVREDLTSANYTMYAVQGLKGLLPGLIRVNNYGSSIALEIWSLNAEAAGNFLTLIRPPLGLGNIELKSREWIKGFICEPYAIAGRENLTHFGGWRNYLKSLE